MKKSLVAALSAPLLALVGTSVASAADMPYSDQAYVAPAPDARGGVRIGYLDCAVGSGLGYVLGSAKEVDCVFHSRSGREDHYTGYIRKFGVDLGYTSRGKMIWAVFAPTAGYHHGSLGGLYEGATAEATIGAGVGANVLFGGTEGSVQLQCLSVTGQLGLNVAATGTSMTLHPAS